MFKSFCTAAAIVLTFVAFVPYIRSILRGRARPHVFSWVIWGLTTFIVFFAQLAGHAGLGAWPIGVSGAISIYIALLAYVKRADAHITGADWGFLAAALSALPLWFLTSNPAWAVVTLTTVDLIGFGPTVRKSFHHPHDESMGFFTLFAVRNFLVVLAVETYSVTTVLFPAVIGLACLLLVFMLAARRPFVERPPAS